MARPSSDRIRALVPGEIPARLMRPWLASIEVLCLLLACRICRDQAVAAPMHPVGLDHERLTYRHTGRDYRLTDVAGNIVNGLLA